MPVECAGTRPVSGSDATESRSGSVAPRAYNPGGVGGGTSLISLPTGNKKGAADPHALCCTCPMTPFSRATCIFFLPRRPPWNTWDVGRAFLSFPAFVSCSGVTLSNVVKVPKRAGVDTEGTGCRDIWEDKDKTILILHGHFLLELLKEMGSTGGFSPPSFSAGCLQSPETNFLLGRGQCHSGGWGAGWLHEGHSRLGGHCCSRECTPGHCTPLLNCNESTRGSAEASRVAKRNAGPRLRCRSIQHSVTAVYSGHCVDAQAVSLYLPNRAGSTG